MVNNIKFKYLDGVRQDEVREANMKNNLDMWLREYEKVINEQTGIVEVLFLSHDQQTFSIKGVGSDLLAKVKERFDTFKV